MSQTQTEAAPLSFEEALESYDPGPPASLIHAMLEIMERDRGVGLDACGGPEPRRHVRGHHYCLRSVDVLYEAQVRLPDFP